MPHPYIIPSPYPQPKPYPQPQPQPQPQPRPRPVPFPYPPPAHLNIRLITDQTSSHNGGPLVVPVNGPLPSPPPMTLDGQTPNVMVVKQRGRDSTNSGGGSGACRSDAFYRAWDKFTARKDRHTSHNRRGGSCSTPTGSANQQTTPASLDIDIEGRPTHPVHTNASGVSVSQPATTSYEEAAAACRQKVEAIVRECKRLNQKYVDQQFMLPERDTLSSLGLPEPDSVRHLYGVGAIRRVSEIFEEPVFFEESASANDIVQGSVGDCWFLAALAALSGQPKLLERLFVARDTMVGVYGFVFFRDGEWVSEVVDDRLALKYGGEGAANLTDFLVFTDGTKNLVQHNFSEMPHFVERLPRHMQKQLRTGSKALYFGSCRDSDETWLPLIEKAYAKAHGDYQAIDGGITGEAIEDLTGGVASYIVCENVLDKDKLWEELKQVNQNFLFGCVSGEGLDSNGADEDGLVRGHAYTVLDAKEITVKSRPEKAKKNKNKNKNEETLPTHSQVKLLKLQNPWGSTEWNGAWSDGSKEWTPEIMQELDHTFGNDGTFFITYADFLKFYPAIDRIRLIGPEWHVTQQWTSVNVPFSIEYLDTSFKIIVKKAGPVVITMSQPDPAYFRGLGGRYRHALHFRLYNENEDTYLIRSMDQSGSMRSCNAETELEPGIYELYVKIVSERVEQKTAGEVIDKYKSKRREKLLAIGKSFHLAHSKGKLRELEHNNMKLSVQNELERRRKNHAMLRELRMKERDRARKRKSRILQEIRRQSHEYWQIIDERRHSAEEINLDRSKSRHHAEVNRSAKGHCKVLPSESKQVNHDRSRLSEPSSMEFKKSPQNHLPPDSQKRPARSRNLGSCTNTKFSRRHEPVANSIDASLSGRDEDPDPSQPTLPDRTINNHSNSEAGDIATETPPVDSEIEGELPATQNNGNNGDVDDTFQKASHDANRPPPTDNNFGPDLDSRILSRSRSRSRSQSRSRSHSRSHSRSRSRSISPLLSPDGSVRDDDFPWDSTMDGSVSPVWDSNDENDWEKCWKQSGPQHGEHGGRETESGKEEEDWQATCVIGLRVCSLDEGVEVEVIRGRQKKDRGEVVMGRARSPA